MIELTRKKRYLLSFLSAFLMVVSFPYTGSVTPLVFISWVPLLLIENNVSMKKYRSSKVFIHSLIVFILYNLGTTWWIWNADEGGAVMAFLLNGLIMALVFYIFHVFKKRFSTKWGYCLLPIFWIGFEFLHYNWELSYPWLNLGNVFSIFPMVVQWYSLTGVLGGTFWVLIVNLLVFFFLKNRFEKVPNLKYQKQLVTLITGFLVIPISASLYIYYSYNEKISPVEIVAVQPNIDPYNEKFGIAEQSQNNQLDKIYSLADKMVTPKTKFVLAPETSIWQSFFEEDLKSQPFYQYTIGRKKIWGNVDLLIGASTFRFFKNKNSDVSRKLESGPGFYESYNSSLLVNSNNRPFIIHKSKLVLGVEKVPFISYIPWLEKLVIEKGGASGTLGIESEPKVMVSKNTIFAPCICYESIYGDFVSKQVKKGAELILIITNDGWWGDTPGYKQHCSFARLRAIENRRSVARSANTGISCFINQRGDVIKETTWWREAVIRGELNKNTQMTFYSLHGDWLGKLFLYISYSLLIYELIKRISRLFPKSK